MPDHNQSKDQRYPGNIEKPAHAMVRKPDDKGAPTLCFKVKSSAIGTFVNVAYSLKEPPRFSFPSFLFHRLVLVGFFSKQVAYL